MTVGGVTAPAGPAVNPNQAVSEIANTPDGKSFIEQLEQNTVLNAMGDMQAMEDKHNNALQEQRENDNGPG
jgi:hypothetical protein